MPQTPEQQASPEDRQALGELQRYLSDQVAPLMVADTIEYLLTRSPVLAARAIEGWVAAQYRGGGSGATMTDYLFHTMKKIHMMAQLKLIELEPMTKYIDALGQIVAELCPAEDRETFRTTLRSLGQAEADTPATVASLHMHAGGGPGLGAAQGGGARGAAAAQPAAMSEEVARGLKRFSLLLQRLETAAGQVGAPAGSSPAGSSPTGSAPAGSAQGEAQAELLTQLLSIAAMNSRTGSDLEQYLARLSQAGVTARTDEVFRALSHSLPGWTLPGGAQGALASALAASGPAEAMRRLVSMAGTPAEGLKRFTEMVQTAIDRFNDGQLAKAAAMIEVAEKLVADKKVDAESAKIVRGRAHQSLAPEYLRAYSEKSDRHPTLRRVMEFFPALSVEELLSSLQGEERRERRKLFLALLEAHGAPAREAAMHRLADRATSGDPDQSGYYARNLVFLLRRIPRSSEVETADPEIALLSDLARWGNPIILIKEAVGALGQIRDPKAEQALMTRLREFESNLLRSETPKFDAEELRVLLDRTASALTRMGTPNAWRTVVNHALREEPALGDTSTRLDDLASQDLSMDRELTDHLVATLRAQLPKKLLGFVVAKKNEQVVHLIHAISGTQAPQVRQVLADIVEKYPEQEFGRVAQKALAGFGVTQRQPEPSSMSLQGDLDLFGLPTLLQTVADARMSGGLTLTGRDGRTMALLEFEGGKVRECRTGALTGESALYQLFEIPAPGTFHFKSRGEAGGASSQGAGAKDQAASEEGLIEVTPAMLEAMRRHDEFQQARAIVPDGAVYKPAGVRPTAPSEGEDPAFLRAVWAQASSGASPRTCETAVATDSYRIRRLYAHWVEQGALTSK